MDGISTAPDSQRRSTVVGLREPVNGRWCSARGGARPHGCDRAQAPRVSRWQIAARRPGVAAQLAEELGVAEATWPPEPGWDLLVNADAGRIVAGRGRDAQSSRPMSAGGLSTIWSTTRRRRRCCGQRTPPAPRRSAGWRCSSSRSCHQFSWWMERSVACARDGPRRP